MRRTFIITLWYLMMALLFSSCGRGGSVVQAEEPQTPVVPSFVAQDVQVESETQEKAEERLPKPESLQDQFSYTYGYMLYSSLKNQFDNLDGAYLALGVTDAADGGEAYFTQSEMEAILKQVQSNMLEQARNEYSLLAEKNKKEAAEFLEKNKLVAGVVTLKSGLQYQVERPGDVDVSIDINDNVTIDYSITALDGTVLSSTYARGRSENLCVSDADYKILQDGLLMMHPGSKFRFYLPPELGFGEEGGGPVGPNQLIIIEVEVKSVRKASQP